MDLSRILFNFILFRTSGESGSSSRIDHNIWFTMLGGDEGIQVGGVRSVIHDGWPYKGDLIPRSLECNFRDLGMRLTVKDC